MNYGRRSREHGVVCVGVSVVGVVHTSVLAGQGPLTSKYLLKSGVVHVGVPLVGVDSTSVGVSVEWS